ncbi:MAG TPA: hypothetical protein VFM07_02265 [Intrasporangium sp.]|nr:hypothetical protein [Intrasporangium sp.]
MSSPVPRHVADELKRVVERWRHLPRDPALYRMPLTADLVQRLADDVAQARGRPPRPVPDLGPAVLMDQLAVMVHDHCDAFGPTRPGARVTDLASELSVIRKAL